MNEITLMPEVAQDLSGNVEQLGAYLVQMAQLMNRMQHRLDEMEENQRKVSLTHEDVKGIQMMIRLRTTEYCEKYRINTKECNRKISAAMKKAILTRYGVKDLHDVPAIARSAVEAQINHWSDSRLMMSCREMISNRSG